MSVVSVQETRKFLIFAAQSGRSSAETRLHRPISGGKQVKNKNRIVGFKKVFPDKKKFFFLSFGFCFFVLIRAKQCDKVYVSLHFSSSIGKIKIFCLIFPTRNGEVKQNFFLHLQSSLKILVFSRDYEIFPRVAVFFSRKFIVICNYVGI
jgi:hypothetical protein